MSRPTPWCRAGRAAPLAAGLFLLAGCATGSLGTSLRQQTEIQIRERGLDPVDVVLPFEPSEEMRQWARTSVATASSPEERLDQLLRAIFRRSEQGVTYEHGYTATAQEVWTTGKANCLSFTHLFVGLARELGLPVYYLRVSDIQSFEKDGDLVVASEHVTAAYGPANERLILDFSEVPVAEYHRTEIIPDLVAVALFYSNLGAQRIRDGRTEEALKLLETATRLAPELAYAWVNLGVAQRRVGRTEQAERSFRRALEADPRVISAYNNLAALLTRSGRHEEAARLLSLTDRTGNRNPFSYVALGDLSLRAGRIEEAARFYRRAQRLAPTQAEALAALGQWALATGDRRGAERWLRKAEKADPAHPRVTELARRLRGSAAAG